jgi:ribonuclease HII
MNYPNTLLEGKLFRRGYQVIAGLDEVGRGALAGPLVAAVVLFNLEQTKRIKRQIEIKESKLLSEKQREEIFNFISQQIDWSLGIVSHQEIDDLGISRANVLVFQRALSECKIKPDYLLLDYVHGFNHRKPFQTIKDGDYKVFTIALASILAKVSRDRLMKEYDHQFPEYGFKQHKGYGTRQHQASLKKFGFCQIHRQSFNLQKFMA